ncbi:hypothetical protein ACI6Q2_08785 [Chitinophagaceae bacterium LWZ2-11]
MAFALTSGPAQPEMQKFTPAGVNDMVDLFSGDFKQNIPLLDVGGYPVNLSYQSGEGMEDEASWVGMGWTLNPGAVNRNMRGLPDDFKGEKVEKIYNKKPFKKVGGRVVLKHTLFAHEIGKGSVSLDVYKDNYYGMGASVSASLNFSLAKSSQTPLTAGLSISSDVRDGVNITPSLGIDVSRTFCKELGLGGLSGGFNYNSRAGLKDYSLGASFASPSLGRLVGHVQTNVGDGIAGSFTHYFNQSYTPEITHNTTNSSFTFSFDYGPTFFSSYNSIGGAGYTYTEQIKDKDIYVPAYGYMNYKTGRDNTNALLDFNREKDGVFLPSAPSIAIPVSTEDFFTASGQTGVQQFRPYVNGQYAVYDPYHSNHSTAIQAGVTLGFGNLFQAGGRFDYKTQSSETGEWVKNNTYLTITKASFDAANPVEEDVYFKQTGEHTRADANYLGQIGNYNTQSVAINDQAISAATAISYPFFKSRELGRQFSGSVKRVNRDRRSTVFSYLTAKQAQNYAFEKTIKNYQDDGRSYINDSRVLAGVRNENHISEIRVTDNEGKRMVYGIPVYNLKKEEVSFSVATPSASFTAPATQSPYDQARQTGLIAYSDNDASVSNTNGRDNYFSKEIIPAYATSYLLTSILSPDYVDVKNDGVTDDDLGTAVKFNYSKIKKVANTNSSADDYKYKWRAPYDAGKANYNEGFLTDTKDDKANYVYGEKEVWYLKTIESKTMIAIFVTSAREDGLGVTANTGGKSTDFRLRKLDRIELYSKADWLVNSSTAVPIKVVHFEYDYSLYPGIPNNSGNPVVVPDSDNPGQTKDQNAQKGKLTLKKVYFTFGTSSRGQSNPYTFDYDLRSIHDGSITNLPAISDATDPESADLYAPRQQDRWGSYKQSFYNKIINNARGLNNSEFPYTLQENSNTAYSERMLNDRLVSKWQLNKITTPTGSIINIQYESDDYAYVQNKRAMQMCFIKGVETDGQQNGLTHAQHLLIELPYPVADVNELKKRYFEGVDKLFYKVLADVDARGHYEYVYGYAPISNCEWVNATEARITLQLIDGYNPIAKQGWQMLRTDLPQYAYDSYDNSDVGDGAAAILSIVNSLFNLRELVQPFESKADGRGFSNTINCAKSMVRLDNPDYKKIGGGSRVKQITISDQWSDMSSLAGAKTATYGQRYDYTIKDNNNNIISSGVAAYEPQTGNEENPFHQPIEYTETVHWGSDKYHYIEKPYCESYFPAPQVGYSSVTVTNFGADQDINAAALVKHTGYIENKFYTAKDFPTVVDYLPLDLKNAANSLTLTLFASVSINHTATSQGFKVELNDMHGKPQSVKVFDNAGALLTSSEYFYNVDDQNAEVKHLNNTVSVLNANGIVENNVPVATDVDLVSDMRQSANESIGTSVGGYVGAFIFPPIPPFIPLPIYIPYGSVNVNASINSDSYNSISMVKVIHRYGMLKKVRTTQNGSTIEAENMVWDGETGDVVLVKNQNEFDDYTYSFKYPAYMVQDYEGMGQAYRNIGGNFMLSTDANNVINSTGSNYLFPGDELISLSGSITGWVINTANSVGTNLRLVDKSGNFISLPLATTFSVIRSGRRNMLSATAGAVVCMNNPIENGRINLTVDKRILDSKAIIYNQNWNIPVYCTNVEDGPGSYNFPHLNAFSDYAMNSKHNTHGPARGDDLNNENFQQLSAIINPYFRNILGNWHPKTNYVYTVNRTQPQNISTQKNSTDIRHSGYYSTYNPFWQFSTSGLVNISANDNRWVWSNQTIYYDMKGNEIETMNALQKYQAALFGYAQSAAVAVASNARHNEIAFDGFEDYMFDLGSGGACQGSRHFNFNLFPNGATYQDGAGNKLTTEQAHTGNYSLKLTGSSQVITASGSANPTAVNMYVNNTGNYVLNNTGNEATAGFAPVQGKKYLLSLWVYDNVPTSPNTQNLSISINGVAYPVNSTAVPVVEGWKKVEIPFTAASYFSLQLTPGGTVYIDDIRIVPYDGQITSFVYDNRNLRLLAQLDENNFATFYEYDEEGTPVRVKKETERGIMTLKENRKSFMKKR